MPRRKENSMATKQAQLKNQAYAATSVMAQCPIFSYFRLPSLLTGISTNYAGEIGTKNGPASEET